MTRQAFLMRKLFHGSFLSLVTPTWAWTTTTNAPTITNIFQHTQRIQQYHHPNNPPFQKHFKDPSSSKQQRQRAYMIRGDQSCRNDQAPRTLPLASTSPSFRTRSSSCGSFTSNLLFATKTGLDDKKSTASSKRRLKKQKAATKKTTSKKKKKPAKEPPFWRNLTDPVLIEFDDKTEDKERNGDDRKGPSSRKHLAQIGFKVRGNPLPLRRHRTSRGFMYNPSAAAQTCFREIVQDMIVQQANSSSTNNSVPLTSNNPQLTDFMNQPNSSLFPLFGNATTLAMTLVFRTKRPQNHFVANNRSRPLKKTAPPALSETPIVRTDVDNLAKFVLDSMNGLLYGDDFQISCLSAVKLLDDEPPCLGSTQVVVSRMMGKDNMLLSLGLNLTHAMV